MVVMASLRSWKDSRLRIVDVNKTERCFGPRSDQQHLVTVNSNNVYRRLLFEGETGIGESYMAGEWSADDLPTFLGAAVHNAKALKLGGPLSTIKRIVDNLSHSRKSNSRSGSEQNIHAHYDLSNEFFQLFLDNTTLAYSCAIFGPDGSGNLADAQIRKFDVICRRLDLKPGSRVLEIGCGWGGFAVYAAKNFGCHVTGITISKEQHTLATKRVEDEKLGDMVSIQYADYRDIKGTFDHIVSIEMFEAVGREYWGQFFEICSQLLVPEGTMLLQTIAIQDKDRHIPMRASGWISKYIFPGGVLPAVAEIRDCLDQTGGNMCISNERDISQHYVLTLNEWRRRFWNRIEDVRRIGFDNTFIRMWDFYLSACSGSFAAESIRDVQLFIENKPHHADSR
tara:strand:- start:2699 stop:3886 length:1188 start_codon:yes stop_codon:yes gene_type:complete